MRSFTLLGLAAAANAHTLFTTLYINDAKQGDGTCVRETHDGDFATKPVIDFASDDVTCGFNGNEAVAYTCAAPAGAKLTFEYRWKPDQPGAGFLDASHKGPAAVYAKRLASADDRASGPGWFKIWGEGFDAEAGKWATEKLMDSDGFLSVDVPAALPAGNYLFRPELVAMHNTTPVVEPQFYVGCAQVFLESSVPEDQQLDVPADKSVSIPGYLAAGDPSLTYNIYDDQMYADTLVPYPTMGPDAWVPAASTGSSTASSQVGDDVQKQTEGGIPSSCLLVNANWCGVEVPSYADSDGCWAAVDNCWAQNDACWAAAPPSGGTNCDVWRTKCDDLNSHCEATDFSGPPAFELESGEVSGPATCPAAVNAGDVATDDSSSATSTSSAAASTETGSSDVDAEATTTTAAAATAAGTTAGEGQMAYPTTTLTTATTTAGTGASSTAAATMSSGVQESSAAPAHTLHCGGKRHHKKRHHARHMRH
ncbi:glycosyl hydrolase family 61-domain-containing protein [Xylariomycetidae sp. FL2044]|nr:glycosyl hydrolase family 61-domain-containing protein [Xylariomycetidae sp. FL2044]